MPVVAREDPTLTARVRSRRRLLYTEGPAPDLDRPAHVRAGSGLAWIGTRLAVIQDDACFVALVDPQGDEVRAVTLPAIEGVRQFDDVRGNKRAKLDLEACVAIDDGTGPLLLAFGSGSTDRRERALVAAGLERGAAEVALVEARALYAALREARAFSGSQLNLEGVATQGEHIVLMQRGNGKPVGALSPVDATCRVERAALLRYLHDPARTPPPPLEAITQYDLGLVRGVRLTFTDVTATPDGGLAFLAAAEASPDTYRDGPVAGVTLGVIDRDGAARWAPLVAADGRPFVDKAEGLALDPHDARRAYLVLDLDDPAAPSELCEVELTGPWW
jgi:hypothetical protein